MESKPVRAKPRISSSASQGFFSRFRRSTRCAFVSFAVPVCAIKRKTHRQLSTGGGSIIAGSKKSLSQQPPGARRHDCATTSTTAHAVEILLVLDCHHIFHSR